MNGSQDSNAQDINPQDSNPYGRFAPAIEHIIEGSKIYHLGSLLERKKMQIDGLVRTDIGMKVIDEECPEARDILIPLLHHEDWGVRSTVASALIRSRPELAIPMLELISCTCTTIAQQSASLTLTYSEVFYPGIAALCRPDPRHPLPEKYKAMVPRTPAP